MSFIVAIVLILQVAAKPADGADPKTIDSAKALIAKIERLQRDEDILKTLDAFGKGLSEEQLPVIESFAVSDSAKDYRFAFAKLLVDRKQVGPAAHVISVGLTEEKENRAYRLWKWWEHLYGDRKDYDDLTWQLTDGLMVQFEKGTPETKLAIAQVFRKGESEAKMPLGDFNKSIDYEGKRAKSSKSTGK
jgi:hypothetical protein